MLHMTVMTLIEGNKVVETKPAFFLTVTKTFLKNNKEKLKHFLCMMGITRKMASTLIASFSSLEVETAYQSCDFRVRNIRTY